MFSGGGSEREKEKERVICKGGKAHNSRNKEFALQKMQAVVSANLMFASLGGGFK